MLHLSTAIDMVPRGSALPTQVQFWNVRTSFGMIFCFLLPVLCDFLPCVVAFSKFCGLPLLPSLHISVWRMNPSGCEDVICLRPDGDVLQFRAYMFFPFDPRLGNHGSGPYEANWPLIFGLTDSFNPTIWLSHMAQAIFYGRFWLCTGESKPKWLQTFSGYHCYNPTSGRRIQNQG